MGDRRLQAARVLGLRVHPQALTTLAPAEIIRGQNG